MVRKRRELSETGMYHVMARGINHQRIYEDGDDYNKFKELLCKYKDEFQFDILAYCFMDNHFHLVMKEKEMFDLSMIMERLLSQYVSWFNCKYHRSGSLITDRFRSKPIQKDDYFWAVIAYIHNNPVAAGIVRHPGLYWYSSYHEFVGIPDLVNVNMAMEIMDISKNQFISWHEQGRAKQYKEMYEQKERDRKITKLILECSGGILPHNIESLAMDERNEIIVKMKEAGLSTRQIERVTGISRGIVYKTIKRYEDCKS